MLCGAQLGMRNWTDKNTKERETDWSIQGECHQEELQLNFLPTDRKTWNRKAKRKMT